MIGEVRFFPADGLGRRGGGASRVLGGFGRSDQDAPDGLRRSRGRWAWVDFRPRRVGLHRGRRVLPHLAPGPAPPEFLYTFTHEFTHLIFAVLCGKRVSRFVVSRDSGQVSMSGTNFLITLAPYFFPLLTVIVLAAGAALEWGLGSARYRPAAAFLTGLTLAFHLTMTLRTLATSQPDIDRGGKLFSWSVVYLFGILFVGSTIFLSAGGGVLDSYLGGLFHEGLTAYTWSAGQFLEWFRIVFSWVAGN